MIEDNAAKRFGLKKVSDLESFSFVKDRKTPLPYSFANKNKVLPLEKKGSKFLVAISDPLNFISIKEAELILGEEVLPVICDEDILEKAIERCYSQKEDTKSIFSSYENGDSYKKKKKIEGYDLLDKRDKNPVIHMLNAILKEAIQERASDIHFEPREDSLEIRYRIDGVLLKRPSPPKEYESQLITRIKVISKLDIAERRLPQDGRIKLKMGKREIDFRISTVPTIYGERIVLRILDRENIFLGLESIGMRGETFSRFSSLISHPEGIILVTGPTGSGKTTTLYSAISHINSKEKNIMTIEDPVEYKLPNIAQIGVNPKINLTFASGLRHILRQDPDVIMIGEIRDFETAEIAIQASLTGHLVFATLHTNDAASAIPRLSDMKIEPYLLASSIIGVLAQRLVRKICSNCREEYSPKKEELEALGIDTDKLYRGKGCSSCFNTGYVGRTGIYELISLDDSIKKEIIRNVDSLHIRERAFSSGCEDLLKSGAACVKAGITSSYEIFRVIRER